MKLRNHLNSDQLKQLEKMGKKRKRNKRPKEEHLNWHDLMGSSNRGMKRGKGGAYRNA